MSIAIRVTNAIFKAAQIKAKAYHRSTAGQIEYWAKIGQIIEDNPDLPFPFIQDILLAKAQSEKGEVIPYKFDDQ